jgi:hypothetical protein
VEEDVVVLAPDELEVMVERAVDKRMEVWLTQLADALWGLDDDEAHLTLRNVEMLRELLVTLAQVEDLAGFEQAPAQAGMWHDLDWASLVWHKLKRHTLVTSTIRGG